MSADPGFFAEGPLDPAKYVLATNVFETDRDPRDAAAHLAQEQSTAQWKRPGVDEDFRPRHGAKVVSVKVLGELKGPSAPSPFDGPGPWKRCEAVLAHPVENFGAKFANMLTVLLGEGTFFSPGIAAIRLVDLALPDAFADQFPGPHYGARGVRDLLGVHNRPLFIGVVKPNVGLPPKEFAALAEEAWKGGLDACKDDEMLADVAWSPLAERAKLCGAARKRAETATGEKKMYVANITDELVWLKPLHDAAVAGGANAVMLNALPLGLPGCRFAREFATVPLLAHFDMVAAMTKSPAVGVESHVMTLLQRLAGFDVILFPGTGARMRTTDEEVKANVEACRRKIGNIAPALPVPGGSSRPADMPATLKLCGSEDFGMVPGRAVFNHPGGPAAGARSFRQAWDAVRDGVALDAKATSSPELAASLEAFA